MKLKLAYSPCPNDTFAFHALVKGLVPLSGWDINPYLADVEELNRLALEGELEMTKLSFHGAAETVTGSKARSSASPFRPSRTD